MITKWLHTVNRFFEHRAVVLMYHRIADVAVDPWELAVSPANFEQQIQLLTEKYTVIPVAELIHQLQQKKILSNAVCLTFDDGYADNFLFAKPILEKHNCPATFFIPSHYTGQERPFWWDALEVILLHAPQLPQLFQLPMQDDVFEFDLSDETLLTDDLILKHKAWAWPAAAPTRRCELYLNIWEHLKPLPLSEIETTLEALKRLSGYAPYFPDSLLPMRSDQLAELANHSLFDIGLHTATHPALAYHNEDVQYEELAENKKALQMYQPINAVAFPYGNYNNSTLSVLQKQRIDAGFTTEQKTVTRASNPRCLGRYQVTNCDASELENKLAKWLKA